MATLMDKHKQLQMFAPVLAEPKAAFTLRDYQIKAVDAAFEQFEQNASTLIVLPTGCGKTATAAEIARRFLPKRVMMLGHREELIFQNKRTLERMTGHFVGIEMADIRADVGTKIVVSTVQTQISGRDRTRMLDFDPADFGLLIVDEAHHATAASWRRVIEHYRQNTELKVLALTATPDRADEEALGQVIESVAYDYEILDAIQDGWLVGVEQQTVNIHNLDFSEIRTTAGDLNGADLARVMELEENLHGIADATLSIVGNRRSLVFTVTVAQAERLCEIFNRHKPDSAAWVCGMTDKDARREILQRFSDGEFQFVVNVGCLTEGFDDPGVEVVVMGRPTKSRSLYAQMVGRGLRPLPGIVDGHELDTPEHRTAAIAASNKKSCLVLDFAGNAGRHKLISTADILGGKYSDEIVETAAKIAAAAGAPVNVAKAFELAAEQIQKRADDLARQAAHRKHIKAKAGFSTVAVDAFGVFDIAPPRSRGWDAGKQLSDKQRSVLLKAIPNLDIDQMPYHEAKALLDEQFRRWSKKECTFKQAKLLKNYGYTGHETMDEARRIIDALAKNGWKKP